jgi:hypothetical protein
MAEQRRFDDHLTILEEQAARRPQAPAFKIPKLKKGTTDEIESYEIVSFSRFSDDVNEAARYWSAKFIGLGLARRSVVGVWSVSLEPLSILFDDQSPKALASTD